MARAASASFKIAETEQGASPTRAATAFRFTAFFSGNIAPPKYKCSASVELVNGGAANLCERLGSMTFGISSRENQTEGLKCLLPRCRTGTDTVRQMSTLSPTQKFHRKDSRSAWQLHRGF